MKKMFTALAIAGAFFVSGTANADTFYVNSYDYTYGYVDMLTAASPSVHSTSAGMFSVDNMTAGDSFNAFCVEISQNVVKQTPVIYTQADPVARYGQDRVNLLSNMVKAAYPAMNDSTNPDRLLYVQTLQVAFWEITSETSNDFSLTSGSTQLTGSWDYNGMLSIYNTLYTNAISGNYVPATVELSLWLNPDNQDLMRFNYSTAATPIPAAVWLMGTGLAGLVAVKRRKSKA